MFFLPVQRLRGGLLRRNGGLPGLAGRGGEGQEGGLKVQKVPDEGIWSRSRGVRQARQGPDRLEVHVLLLSRPLPLLRHPLLLQRLPRRVLPPTLQPGRD